MQELLEAGVHFGHQTKRWNPKMKKYIFGQRNGIYLIDLSRTSECLRQAEQFVMRLASENRTLLFVGTKRQAQDLIVEEAVSSEPLPGFPNPVAVTSIAIGRGENRLWYFYASSRISVVLVMKRDPTTSENEFVDGDEDISPADEFIRQARIFVRNLDWTRARIRFEQALDLDPHRVDIRCELGMVYQELGDERAALGQFDIVLTQDPIDA